MALTKADKTYIDHVFGSYTEIVTDKIQMLAELIQDRPTRNEVHDMIDTSLRPIEQRLIRVEAKIS